MLQKLKVELHFRSRQTPHVHNHQGQLLRETPIHLSSFMRLFFPGKQIPRLYLWYGFRKMKLQTEFGYWFAGSILGPLPWPCSWSQWHHMGPHSSQQNFRTFQFFQYLSLTKTKQLRIKQSYLLPLASLCYYGWFYFWHFFSLHFYWQYHLWFLSSR